MRVADRVRPCPGCSWEARGAVEQMLAAGETQVVLPSVTRHRITQGPVVAGGTDATRMNPSWISARLGLPPGEVSLSTALAKIGSA